PLDHLQIRLLLREHEAPKLSPGERSPLVESHPNPIFIQRKRSLRAKLSLALTSSSAHGSPNVSVARWRARCCQPLYAGHLPTSGNSMVNGISLFTGSP
ncbi:MAG: hypothetical protein WCC36_09260, partial [Gammaproteobacteria bacterium]